VVSKCFFSSLQLPEKLPSVEKQMKVLAAALDESQKSDLDKMSILRLRSLIQGVKTYKELLLISLIIVVLKLNFWI
jgi:hypothetical protein